MSSKGENGLNISYQLAETADRHPEKEAYIFMDRPASYAELNEQVERFAGNLAQLGINKGDHVALLLGNSPHFVISLYGAIRAGATVIPVNPIYTADEIGYILNNGDVKTVITLDKLVPLFEKMESRLPQVEQIIVVDTLKEEEKTINPEDLSIYPKLKPFTGMVQNRVEAFKAPELNDDDTAVILYTSGTTGKPKGAMLTQKNIYSNAKDTADYLKITESDRVIATLPMFHVFCLTVALNAPLMNGGTVIIVPQFSPAEIFRISKKLNPTIFAGVPTMYNYLYQYPDAKTEDLESLRLCISGGSPLPVSLLKEFEKKFNVAISEGYGLSEASPVTAFNPLDRPRKAGSIGMSITHVENRVVDEMGEEVKPGEVGELIVRGPNVMKGYYKMPEDSAAALKDGWLYTGDLAKMDEEGYFYIVDRKKDLVLVGGYNVYPREVEEIFYQHPNVVEAAVLGVPDPNLGEAVHAFVVVDDNNLTEQDFFDYCAEHLAKYKVPAAIEFLEELPKNTTGKILRRALKDQVQA